MNKDYLAIAFISVISVLLLLVFVRKHQVREAFLAFMMAQLFSWPITLLFVQFGLQSSPVRLFPHATGGNFIFAFLFHPASFAVFYLRYPKKSCKGLRLLYTLLVTLASILVLYFASLYTNLIFFPYPSVLIASYFIIAFLYTISRKYLDWYFDRLHLHGRGI